ncbi:MAG: hypothetical protein ACHQ4G_04925 [Opitutales bacterium]
MRLIALLLLLAAPALAQDVGFVRVWPGWRDANSFVHIAEYFGGREDTRGQTMLRTQPADRTGFYFLARTRNTGAAQPGAKFVLDIITPDSPHPKTYTFSTSLPSGEHVFNVGLTGNDWAGAKIKPVAWRLRLLAGDGRELTEYRSFLWSMPPAGER